MAINLLQEFQLAEIAAAFPSASKRNIFKPPAPLNASAEPEDSKKEEEEDKDENNLLNGLAQLSGLLGGDEQVATGLVDKPPKPAGTDVVAIWNDPSLLEDIAKSKAYAAAKDKINDFLEKQLKDLTENLFLNLTEDEPAPKVVADIMSRVPDAEFLEDPLGWIQQQWTGMKGDIQKRYDEFFKWENLCQMGANVAIDQALKFGEKELMNALGLIKIADTDPAGAHIAAELLGGYLLPELKAYFAGEAIAMLKEQFPASLALLEGKERENLLDQLKEVFGMGSDAGCVPIALRYDKGDHGGSIETACATTVVAGKMKIAVARQGDGFVCPTHVSSNPVKEGIENILVEGLPITAHKFKTTCDARIVASPGHNVFVADAYPLVNLPLNGAPSCSAPPLPPAPAPATAAVKPKPAPQTPKAAGSPEVPQDRSKVILTPEQREERQHRLSELQASAGDSKEMFEEWLAAKRDLAAKEAKLKSEENSLEQMRSARREIDEKLMMALLTDAAGSRMPSLPAATMEQELLESSLTPVDKLGIRVGMYQDSTAAKGYVKEQERQVEDLKAQINQAKERENQAAVNLSDAVKDTAKTVGQIFLTPLDMPIPRIKLEQPERQ